MSENKKNENNKVEDKETLKNKKNKQSKTSKTQEKKNKEPKKKEEVDYKELLEQEKEKYIRLYAEFDNYKKRMAKERLEILSLANIETINAMLPILDDIDMAKDKLEKTEETKGIFLIMDKLFKVLKDKGLERIEVKKADDFNVDLHEAITNILIEDEKMDGKIYDVISRGYKLNDKIIRHSKVVIGQKNK